MLSGGIAAVLDVHAKYTGEVEIFVMPCPGNVVLSGVIDAVPDVHAK